jgi:hypothetical protein
MGRDFFHTGLNVGRSDILSLLDGKGPGDTYYVDYRKGADGNDGKSWANALRTYGEAIDRVTDNNNDIIYIDGDSEVVELAMVSITKNRVHTVGWNGPFSLCGMGPGARITLGVTTDAADIATIQNTGVRNTFTGIKFSNSNTLATNLYTFAEGGEYSRFFYCEFYKSALLTTDLTAPLLMNGDSSQFYGCTFGDLANTRGAASTECPCVMLTREQIAGKVCRDGWFEDCRFLTKAAHIDVCHVYGVGATAVERSLVFKNCIFWNCVLAAATVADAVNFSTAQTTGDVLLINPAGIKVTAIAGASLNIYVSSGTAQTTDGVSEEIAA